MLLFGNRNYCSDICERTKQFPFLSQGARPWEAKSILGRNGRLGGIVLKVP